MGKALANLKLPGVGALSQSTICRLDILFLWNVKLNYVYLTQVRVPDPVP